MSLVSSAKAARAIHYQSRNSLVRAELVRLLFTNANVGILVTLVAAPLLVYLQKDIARPAIIGWLLYMPAVSAARFHLGRLYERSSTISTRTERWGAARSAWLLARCFEGKPLP